MRALTYLDHLRNLLECDLENNGCCHFCGKENGASATIKKHDPDCPWVAAKTFVEDKNRRISDVKLDSRGSTVR
jgi:hypothetical protein